MGDEETADSFTLHGESTCSVGLDFKFPLAWNEDLGVNNRFNTGMALHLKMKKINQIEWPRKWVKVEIN